MKQYYLGALVVCLVAPACAKHNTSPAAQTAKNADQAAEQADSANATAQQAMQQAEDADKQAQSAAQQAEDMDRPEMPAHQEHRETASAPGTEIDEAHEGARLTPGADDAPGTTKAEEAGQGTTRYAPHTSASAPKKTPDAMTPMEQGTSESDRKMTQRIRRALIDDDSLSFTAKNVKIITRDGNVLLRGLVLNDKERKSIEDIARGYASSGRVDNQLELKNQTIPAPITNP